MGKESKTRKTPKNTRKTIRVNKLNEWFKAYTNPENPKTYLNKTQSAKAAGYKASSEDSFAQIGCQNFNKLKVKIDAWLDENGLSEEVLKTKLISLFEGQEIKIMTLKGEIETENLSNIAQIIASGVSHKVTPQGTPYTERETIIGISVENKELQRRALDMGFKVKGVYAPQKREVMGKDGGPIRQESELSYEAQSLLDELIGTEKAEE